MSVIEITSVSEFEKYGSPNGKADFVFVDFYATWCGPCKRIAPSIDSLAKIYKNIDFLKVDIDVCHEMAEKYNVTSLPTFMIFQRSDLKSGISIVGADLPRIEYALKLLTGGISEGEF